MRHQAGSLKRELETQPGVEKVKLRLGGGGVLDVFADGKLVFSKKQAGHMPTTREILHAINAS
ncbi:MAG TPA: Rdx family protein [Terriglobales bacterium]|nr:Rdx family protein [Terriglobales bacterium]